MCTGVQAIHHKCSLLAAHSQQVDEDVVRYKEYATRMADKAETLARLVPNIEHTVKSHIEAAGRTLVGPPVRLI